MKPRIYLRAIEPSDYEISYKWRNDPEIQSMIGGHSFFVSREKEKEWVNNAVHSNEKTVLAICLVENDKYIGNVMIQEMDYINGTAHVPILIGDKDEWGKGYATEARFLALKFVFEERRINRVWALIKDDNIGSMKMHEKCGYKKEGVLRQSIFKNGAYHDQVLMSVLKEEFEEAYLNYLQKFS